MRGLQPQETLDGRLQRVGGVRGLGLVPPAVMVRIEAEPAAPLVEVAVDILLARIVKQHRPVTKLLLVGGHAEDVGGQHRGRLALVAVELVHRLAPVVAASHVALVLGDHEGDAVDQQHRVVAALLDALHAILIGRGEVVQMLTLRLECDELHGPGVLAGTEHDPGAVAQQVERRAVGGKPVRLPHRLAQRLHRPPRLRLGLHVRVKANDGLLQQLLDERVFQGRPNSAMAASSRYVHPSPPTR